RIHSRIRGTEPLSGTTYDPNDPAGQLWIHLTQWHSVLYVYERFGPGRLSFEEEEQYWAECRTAATFQTIDPDSVPRNRAEMRAYYARVRPDLAASTAAIEHVRIILETANPFVTAAPGRLRFLRPILRPLARRATIATLPAWMRSQVGIRQSRLTDAVVTALIRPMFRMIARRPRVMADLLRAVSPLAHPVIAPVILGIAPELPETVPVAEAWRRAARPTPREQHLASRDDVVAAS
ncbi:oxygenase MpaB family protein, partial [Aeromicrobium sp.]|uniref:oxygenase MpaB family protein n=1 Tax=Aeromicrobium sp. TaxID=1871063 RepID=UPI003C6686FD